MSTIQGNLTDLMLGLLIAPNMERLKSPNRFKAVEYHHDSILSPRRYNDAEIIQLLTLPLALEVKLNNTA